MPISSNISQEFLTGSASAKYLELLEHWPPVTVAIVKELEGVVILVHGKIQLRL